MKRKVYFRADGDTNIGMGHVVRILALADMLSNDYECIFATRFISDFVRSEASFCKEVIQLPENQTHFNEFLTYLAPNDIVVLDNYFFDTDYQRQIKAKGCKLVCIDDMHDKHYVADMVINHAIGLKEEQFSVESYTRLCLGLDYALLRKPFLNAIPRERTEYKRCLVCIGGADKHNITTKLVNILDKKEEIDTIDVVLGSAFIHKRALSQVIELSEKDVNLFENLTAEQMVERMQTADFGILPASSISLEAIAVGMPFLLGWYVDNQEEYYQNLLQTYSARGLGNLLDIQNLDVTHIVQTTHPTNKIEKSIHIFFQQLCHYK